MGWKFSVVNLAGSSLLSVCLLSSACSGRAELEGAAGHAGLGGDSGSAAGGAAHGASAGQGAGAGEPSGTGGTSRGGAGPETAGSGDDAAGASAAAGAADAGGATDVAGAPGADASAAGASGAAESDAGASGASGAAGADTSGEPPGDCAPSASGPAHWAPAASMAQPRGEHSATLLKNGKVLVVGGFTGNVSVAKDLASAELYDPCADTWTPAGELSTARNDPSAVLLADGRVLVVGGILNGWSVETAELYDPSSNTWSLTSAPPGPGVAVALDNGRVLLIGSDVGDNTVALYDAATSIWSSTGHNAHPRISFSTTTLANGNVLISGGFSTEPYTPAVLEAEQYDPFFGLWSSAGMLSRMRSSHAPVLLRSGRVLISGGYPQAPSSTPTASSEIYDPISNTWSDGEDLVTARWIHTTTLLPDGRVLVVGGSSSSGANSALTSAELYDEASGKFSTAASLSVPRWSHTATPLSHGRVLVIGGEDGTSFLNSVEIYTPDAL